MKITDQDIASEIDRAVDELMSGREAITISEFRVREVLSRLAYRLARTYQIQVRVNVLTPTQVAERYSVTPAAVGRWCKRGLLPNAEYFGSGTRGVWLIPAEALDNFVPPPRKGGRRKGEQK